MSHAPSAGGCGAFRLRRWGNANVQVGLSTLGFALLINCTPADAPVSPQSAAVAAEQNTTQGPTGDQVPRAVDSGLEAKRPSSVATSNRPRYTDKGRRDPFNRARSGKKIVSHAETQQFGATLYKIKAIIGEGRARKALVEDPEGAHFIVERNDVLGHEGGRISRINEHYILVVVSKGPNGRSQSFRLELEEVQGEDGRGESAL